MNPLYFGTVDHELFGVYHAPQSRRVRHGVVLCYPWGREYLLSHRLFKLLAERLAGSGIPVLRFDYYGTGDSSGDLCGGADPSWAGDVSSAIDELRQLAGVRKVGLFGLRMGAAWAAAVARRRHDVDRFVALDPIVDGPEYLHELDRLAVRDAEGVEVLGFLLTDLMRREFEAVNQETYRGLSSRGLLVTTDEGLASDARSADQTALGARPAGDDGPAVEHVPGPPAWTSEDSLGISGLPVAAVDRIVSWLR